MMHDAWLILPITSNNRIQASVTELHNITFICLYNSGFSIRKKQSCAYAESLLRLEPWLTPFQVPVRTRVNSSRRVFVPTIFLRD